MSEENEITEYKLSISEAFVSAGFTIKPVNICGVHMKHVINEDKKIIGYLIVNEWCCSVGNEHYSIPFDDVQRSSGGPRGVQLMKGGRHVGSLNL